MKSKKTCRLWSLALVLTLLLTAFTGCGSTNVVTPGSNSESQTPSVTPEPSATPVEEKPVKFTMSVSNGLNEYVMKSPDINQDKWLKEINKRFNCEITLRLIDHGKYNENMQILFASGDLPDVVKGYESYLRPDMADSVQNGVFLALDDLLEQNKADLSNIHGQIPADAWNEMKYEGKIYGIPSTYLSMKDRRATYIRKDLLEKVGMEPPKNLEDSIKVLKAFKDIGVPYPFAGREFWLFTTTFFGAFGVEYTVMSPDKDGNMTPDMIKPEMKEALAFHNKLYKEGLMDPESLTTNPNDWLNKIYSGKVGMFEHQPGQLHNFNSNLQKHVPDGEFLLIAAPEGPYGDKGYRNFPQVGQALYINKDYPEPLRLLKLIDSMGAPEAQEFFTFGILGENYVKKDGKIEYTMPTEPIDQQEASFREKTLNLLRDDSINELLMPFKPTAQAEKEYRDNVAPHEGIEWYDCGPLKAFEEHPDLKPAEKNCNLFLECAAKIFYGQLPPEAHDEFVQEYLKRGGDKIIEEATEAYKAGKVFKR